MIIYKTTNTLNGKIYIGQDAINDPEYLGSGTILSRAIKKYGRKHFRKNILEHCSSKEELNRREIFWINELHSTDRKIGYNIAIGGTGGDTFTHQPPEKQTAIIAKRNAHHDEWCTIEYRKRAAERTTQLWQNPSHRNHMVKAMTGRNIIWADKISESIKKWHKTNPISEESKRRAAIITSQKMRGYEFKSISTKMESRIIELYQTRGPRLIERETGVSRYLVTRLLKKRGIYQKWQKGIGEKSSKLSSVSRRGNLNPMAKHSS